MKRPPLSFSCFVLPALPAFLLLAASGCREMPSPPSDARPGLYRDDAGVWRDSLKGLFQDSLGIWRGTDADSLPFLDMPLPYRDFWRTCANCHSASGKAPSAGKARKALTLNTWREMLAYGPDRLVLAGKAGGMPPAPYAPVPVEVLTRVQAYLAAWPDSQPPIRVRGYRFGQAADFVRTYCADCHSPGGGHAEQPLAAIRLMLDDYGDWRRRQHAILDRLDTNHLLPMPPVDYLSELDSAERDDFPAMRARMRAWIDSLSPNNAEGSGRGDSVPARAAFGDLRYEPVVRIVNAYCADCHTGPGLNLRQLDGWSAVPFDTWARWKRFPDARASFARRLDSAASAQARVELMPPPAHFAQPTTAERDTLRGWLLRGAPNTEDGL